MEIIKSVSEVRNQFPALYGCSTLYQINRYSKLLRRFNAQYKEKGGYMCSSSGRVEVIGNHTDHNGGKVVACAISLDILAVFLPDDEFITIKSEGYPDIRFRINELEPCGANSQSMAKGVIKGLLNRGYKVGGFKATITSNVVGGAGISSSAAYELLICEIENGLYNNGAVTPI
ncbi:MAG: galactokinase family protein, partial [Clostridia bacterium]